MSRALRIKAAVVGRDEHEAGERAVLNYGHTNGHAIETVAGYRRVRHGEAVAMGMAFAARLSQQRGLCGAEASDRLLALLERIGLPVEAPDWKAQRAAYLRAVAVDKKVRGDKVRFVVLREIGRAELLPLTPREILEEAR